MTRRRKHPAERGLSAIELIVVTAVSGVLLAMVQTTSRAQVQTMNREYATNAVQPSMRLWMARFAEAIRGIGYDPLETTSFGLLTHTATELTFTTDSDADGVLDANETIGIRLSSGELQFRRGANWRTAIPSVVNQEAEFGTAVFVYLDGAGIETASISNVHAIRITIHVRTSTAGVSTMGVPVLSQTITAEIRNDLLRGEG